MLQLFKKVTVKQIHDEFDNAQERILQEAYQVLGRTPSNKATKLISLGFTKAKGTTGFTSTTEMTRSKDLANLVEFYKINFPFQKFITEDEMDRICKKYRLIHAPVSHYKEEVPDKNLAEIENCPSLGTFAVSTFKTIKVTEFWSSCPEDLRELLSKPILYAYDGNDMSEWEVIRSARIAGYKGNYSGNIFRKAKIEEVDHNGLFIAAPRSHFDLTELKKQGKFGFKSISIQEIHDPIVFRYCKGGIQIITKWGDEASDEIVVNEIEN